jgi:hypothetical protein
MQTRGSCHWLVGTRGNKGHVMDQDRNLDPGDLGIHPDPDPPVYISRVVS